MDITYDNGILTAYLDGEIDHHRASEMRIAIDDKIVRHNPKLLIIDFTDVEFMDSSGIGLVLGRYKLIDMIGGKVKITNTPPYITKVMRIAGIEGLCEIDNSKPLKNKTAKPTATVNEEKGSSNEQ